MRDRHFLSQRNANGADWNWTQADWSVRQPRLPLHHWPKDQYNQRLDIDCEIVLATYVLCLPTLLSFAGRKGKCPSRYVKIQIRQFTVSGLWLYWSLVRNPFYTALTNTAKRSLLLVFVNTVLKGTVKLSLSDLLSNTLLRFALFFWCWPNNRIEDEVEMPTSSTRIEANTYHQHHRQCNCKKNDAKDGAKN